MTPRYAPFLGDQRHLVHPPVDAAYGTHPVPVRASVANMIIDRFVQNGYSYHSRAGSTMWVVVSYCRFNGFGFSVEPTRDTDNFVLSWCVRRTSKPHIRFINGCWCLFRARTSPKPFMISPKLRHLVPFRHRMKSRA